MSKSWAGGSTRRWREVRAFVLERDGWQCQVQLPGCEGRARHAHHVQGRAVTGDDPRYVVAACEHCNLKIGDPTKKDPPAQPDVWW